jgi:transglutaminase-like putative cysteine protease
VGVVSDFYGDELALGTGTNLGADVIFSVKPNLAPPENTRFYWRARSYDEYSTQDGWQTTVKAVDEFVPDVQGEQLDYPSWDGLQRIEFRFNPQVSLLRTMYTASQPIWVSRPVNVIYGIVPGGAHDISTVQANPPLRAGESYTAVSMIGSPTITALRGSGDLYPEWVRERYLRLPENFSPAVQALANQITEGLDNPYDKVEAVTRYLRENITYTTTVGSPPEGMDPIEWFLFELQAGYCNYYASAEVLLLRSIGIPARLAAGFAQGEVNAESGGYVVRQRDAHAWPEVYFNEYGWVEFEPTVSQPARQLPLGEDSDPTGSETITQLPDALAQIDEGPLFDPENVYGRNTIDLEAIQEAEMVRQRNRAYTLAFGGVSLLVLAYLAWRILQNRFQAPPLPVFLEESLIRHGRRAPAWLISWARSFRYTPIQKAYNGINRSLNILSVKVPQSATPREREQALADHLPAVHEAGTRIIEEYHRETYGQTRGDASRVTGVAKMMQNLALRTRLAQIYAKIVKRKGTSQAENK